MLSALGWGAVSRFSYAAPPLPLFEEVPPASSRITWVHDAGRSPNKYLPESTGPGCAFLDYDNDGWMDTYLINSGTWVREARLTRWRFAGPPGPPRS
jgi:hypothetical protein